MHSKEVGPCAQTTPTIVGSRVNMIGGYIKSINERQIFTLTMNSYALQKLMG
jgi:hypothetical protein